MNMNDIVGQSHILFITLDTLRFDVATAQMDNGLLPNFARYHSKWEARQSPASFTYPAHHAFFSGFLPSLSNTQERLFSSSFDGSTTVGSNTWVTDEATWIQGLSKKGYVTSCFGGVGFFNKKNAIGSVLPSLFQYSFWNERFGVTDPSSTETQVLEILSHWQSYYCDLHMTFLNISAIHQPNYFYRDTNPNDDLESHAAALRYADSQLGSLFTACEQKQQDTFVILCSDHGTCYGEGGITGHKAAHEVVWTVPYMEFLIGGTCVSSS